MTPKEKAKELVDKYSVIIDDYHRPSKQCALIAVDEIIKYQEKISEHYWIDLEYWQEVKKEIEKA